jgi:hypothetical protein
MSDNLIDFNEFLKDPANRTKVVSSFDEFLSMNNFDKSDREVAQIKSDQISDLKNALGLYGSMFESDDDVGLMRYVPLLGVLLNVIVLLIVLIK